MEDGPSRFSIFIPPLPFRPARSTWERGLGEFSLHHEFEGRGADEGVSAADWLDKHSICDGAHPPGWGWNSPRQQLP